MVMGPWTALAHDTRGISWCPSDLFFCCAMSGCYVLEIYILQDLILGLNPLELELSFEIDETVIVLISISYP